MVREEYIEIKRKERRYRENNLPFGQHVEKNRSRWSNIIELTNVFEKLKLKNGQTLIDIGCADGRFLTYVNKLRPQCKLYGIDFAINPLKILSFRNFKCLPACADISELPFKPGSFDKAASVQTLQQLPSRELRIRALKSAHCVLKANARLVITVLNQITWYPFVKNGREGPLLTCNDLYVHLYNAEELETDLNDAGFKVIKICGINNLPGRYTSKLHMLGKTIDCSITNYFTRLSLKKGSYLLAECLKN